MDNISEGYAQTEPRCGGQMAVVGEKHEAVVIVVRVARAKGRAKTGIDIEYEPTQHQLVAALGKEGSLGGVRPLRGCCLGIRPGIVVTGKDKLRLEIEAGKGGVGTPHREDIPLVGRLDKQTARVGMVHDVETPANDPEGELGAGGGGDGTLVGEARRPAAQRKEGDLHIVARARGGVVLRRKDW